MAPTVAPARASGFVGTKLRQPLNPLKVIIIIKYIVILSLSNIPHVLLKQRMSTHPIKPVGFLLTASLDLPAAAGGQGQVPQS